MTKLYRVVITQHYECPCCGYKWDEKKIVVDPNYQKLISMKYKKKVENLKRAQAWWDKQDQKFKNATTRPGSVKQRVITGNNK